MIPIFRCSLVVCSIFSLSKEIIEIGAVCPRTHLLACFFSNRKKTDLLLLLPCAPIRVWLTALRSLWEAIALQEVMKEMKHMEYWAKALDMEKTLGSSDSGVLFRHVLK